MKTTGDGEWYPFCHFNASTSREFYSVLTTFSVGTTSWCRIAKYIPMEVLTKNFAHCVGLPMVCPFSVLYTVGHFVFLNCIAFLSGLKTVTASYSPNC
jgi:hypothetical protein